jgi:hypothetical protein
MHDDHMILRRTAITDEHLACPLRGCTYIIECPAIPISDGVAGAFGLSGKTLASMHADLASSHAAQAMRIHLAGHTPEDWLQLIEHTVMILEVRQ